MPITTQVLPSSNVGTLAVPFSAIVVQSSTPGPPPASSSRLVVHDTRRATTASQPRRRNPVTERTETTTPAVVETPIPIFDGHNDTLLDLGVGGRSFSARSE